MEAPQKTPTELEKLAAAWPLYVRIGFGTIILFGMVGNCAGHREGSLAVFVLTAILWACTRIVQEAIDSIRILHAIREHRAAQTKAPEKKDPPESGPETPSGPPTGT